MASRLTLAEQAAHEAAAQAAKAMRTLKEYLRTGSGEGPQAPGRSRQGSAGGTALVGSAALWGGRGMEFALSLPYCAKDKRPVLLWTRGADSHVAGF